jgi:hypothetical protein
MVPTNPVKLADRPVIRTTETRIKFLDQAELEKLLVLALLWAVLAGASALGSPYAVEA